MSRTTTFLGALAICLSVTAEAGADGDVIELSGEQMYEHLSQLARQGGPGATLFRKLAQTGGRLDWASADVVEVTGNIRCFEVPVGGAGATRDFYLVREVDGSVHVLALPRDGSALQAGAQGPYADLQDKVGKKVSFQGRIVDTEVDGYRYSFLSLTTAPERLLLDRLFFIAIIILLFLTMVGMGMTLTVGDFALVFRKPLGMIIGPVCQFGLMPLLAMVLGRVFGFYEAYPFIFLGLILIASSPGGVTSNLMTYFGKGDVALSVSLTAVCTVLALVFTPLLLKLYGSNIPDFSIPVMEVFKTMLVLVIVPLAVGMVLRWRAETFARRSEKVFAAIGLFALLFLIVVGILGNLDKFADTQRYGFKFYSVVFVLTFAGMIVSGLLSKLGRVSNYQIRAIALETGLRNASLAMTIALLLQDRMGDFYSSMFFTSGIFGLFMYVAGAATIFLFPRWLPVTERELSLHKLKGKSGGAGAGAGPAQA
jgi:BASS family bile acid:Na+ symporter